MHRKDDKMLNSKIVLRKHKKKDWKEKFKMTKSKCNILEHRIDLNNWLGQHIDNNVKKGIKRNTHQANQRRR